MFICKYGGYPTLRHNEIRDLTSSLLKEVCPSVSVEPRLQPITGEQLRNPANQEDEARVDIKARGFWSYRAELGCNSKKGARNVGLQSSTVL